jgi:molybdopterin molybdotransferase
MGPFFTGDDSLPTVSAEATSGVDLPEADFEYAVPVVLEDGDAVPLGQTGSGLSVYEDTFDPSVLSSSTRATRADGFVMTESGFDAGETVAVVPYDAVE